MGVGDWDFHPQASVRLLVSAVSSDLIPALLLIPFLLHIPMLCAGAVFSQLSLTHPVVKADVK